MQEISFVQLITLGYGVVLPILGYFLKDVMEQVKEAQKELNSLHEKYVRRDDFSSFKEELWRRFDRVEAKLDTKPDSQ